MTLRKTFASAVGALALAAAAAYAPAASADRVGFNVTFGGPGYAVNVGNGGFGYYDTWRPAPVVVAPYVPYTYYERPYYRPYVPVPVYRPYPVYRPHYVHRHHSDRHHHRSYGHGNGHRR